MNIFSLDLESAKAMLPKRDPEGHKGTFGKVLLICGSKNMVGCCYLATIGALRSGCGLVTIAFPDVLYNSLTSRLTESLFLPLPTDARGFISYEAVGTILDVAESYDAVMIGCGIGTDYGSSLLTTSLIQHLSKPLILDADALNCVSVCPAIIKERVGETLLTPHPGEMSRLVKKTISEIEADREKIVAEFSAKYEVNTLLKGKETLICNSTADTIFVNKTGNSGLAKGGSGDLLSGIITGLTPGFNGDLFQAAVLGAFVHGYSADILKDEFSEYALLPTDCAGALTKVYSIIEGVNC